MHSVETRNYDAGKVARQKRKSPDERRRDDAAAAASRAAFAARDAAEREALKLRYETIDELRAAFEADPLSDDECVRDIKAEHDAMVAAAKKRAADEAKDEASRSVPKPAELKRRILTPEERARVDKIDAPWRGVAKAYLEHDWPLPFWFSAGALAQGNETLELIVEQYEIDTMDELGHWFGAMCSDAYFDVRPSCFKLKTTNRDYADLQRANLPHVPWKTTPRCGGKMESEFIEESEATCSNGAKSWKYTIMTTPGGDYKLVEKFYPNRTRDESGKKVILPPDLLNDPLFPLALTATPAWMDATFAGDGTLYEGHFSLAFNRFTPRELDWFISLLGRSRWRDGTAAVVHGAFPMVKRKKGRKGQYTLDMTEKSLKDAEYAPRFGSEIRTHGIRVKEFIYTAALPVTRAYPHKGVFFPDNDLCSAACAWKSRGESFTQIIVDGVIRGFSLEELQAELLRATGLNFADKYLFQIITKPRLPPGESSGGEKVLGRHFGLGLPFPPRRTCDKTGNADRVKHPMYDVNAANVIIGIVRKGGRNAEQYGGLDCGGEDSVKHFMKMYGAMYEEYGYIIDARQGLCIFPGGTIDRDLTPEVRDAQQKYHSGCVKNGEFTLPELIDRPADAHLRVHLAELLEEKLEVRALIVKLQGWSRELRRPASSNKARTYFIYTDPDTGTIKKMTGKWDEAIKWIISDQAENAQQLKDLLTKYQPEIAEQFEWTATATATATATVPVPAGGAEGDGDDAEGARDEDEIALTQSKKKRKTKR